MADAVEEVRLLVENQLRVAHVAFSAEVDDRLPPVLADQIQVQQVLMNLILNAVEALQRIEPTSRRVKIRRRSPTTCWRPRSATPDAASRPSSWKASFIRFTPPNRKEWGWASRSADPLSNGTAAGFGPRATISAELPSLLPSRLPRRNLAVERKPTIYVLDDEPQVLEAITHLVEPIEAEVETYCRADDFLASFRDDGPACLVLDVRLPGMSGMELQKHLRKRDIAFRSLSSPATPTSAWPSMPSRPAR